MPEQRQEEDRTPPHYLSSISVYAFIFCSVASQCTTFGWNHCKLPLSILMDSLVNYLILPTLAFAYTSLGAFMLAMVVTGLAVSQYIFCMVRFQLLSYLPFYIIISSLHLFSSLSLTSPSSSLSPLLSSLLFTFLSLLISLLLSFHF